MKQEYGLLENFDYTSTERCSGYLTLYAYEHVHIAENVV